MSRYHTQYVFFSPVGGVEGGDYGSGDSKLHKNMKGCFPGRVGKGTQVHVRGSLYSDRGRIQGRAQASASAGSLPRHPQGKWPGPASRDYSPAAVLTSRTVHSSEGTRQGRCSEEVIPGPAKKQESRDKKYGK